MHTVEIKERVGEPENGLMLGNGDLAVSIYQTEDLLIWRFGKNDVWDRRLDLSDCPEAAHIEELARGIRDEKWVSYGYVNADASALGTVSDPQRMEELCNGWPAYARRPYPCPKPVGEFALHLPVDQRGLKMRQKLSIEKGVVDVRLRWQSGAGIDLHCFVPPTPNTLVVRWKLVNWTDETGTDGRPPVWFTLYRWPDPTIAEFATKMNIRAKYPHNYAACVDAGKSTPLPAPTVKEICGRLSVEQTFYPDLEYEDGFRYAMTPFAGDLNVEECDTFGSGWSALHLLPADAELMEGEAAVVVPASSDKGGVEGELKRVLKAVGDDFGGAAQKWANANHRSARAFWGRSSLEMNDRLMENMWYEQLHLRRCSYRADIIAPGLAMPSTIYDYSLWHGDIHTNYNYQEPFWGALYRNIAGGSLSDVTETAQVGDMRWSTGCAFSDYDRDGDLDLYVANYVDYSLEDSEQTFMPYISMESVESLGPELRKVKAYPHPDSFDGVDDVLYRNDANGRFQNVTRAANLYNAAGKGLGVVWGDCDNDGDPDLYVANDNTPNFLYINDGDGAFVDNALVAGTGYGEDGRTEAGMGVDLGDYNNDQLLDIWVTNFQGEPNALYENEGNGFFTNVSFRAAVGAPSLRLLGWGGGFLDVDRDGYWDLFNTNGHVLDNIELIDNLSSYPQPCLLLRNAGPQAGSTYSFEDISEQSGPEIVVPRIGRGVAFGDYDNDGAVGHPCRLDQQPLDPLTQRNRHRPQLADNQAGWQR